MVAEEGNYVLFVKVPIHKRFMSSVESAGQEKTLKMAAATLNTKSLQQVETTEINRINLPLYILLTKLNWASFYKEKVLLLWY